MPKILIADDDESIRLMIAGILEDDRYETDMAENRAVAYEKAYYEKIIFFSGDVLDNVVSKLPRQDKIPLILEKPLQVKEFDAFLRGFFKKDEPT